MPMPGEPVAPEERKEFYERHYHQAYNASSLTYDEKRWEPAWGRYLKEATDEALVELLAVGPGV